jgi:hypothetical protein
MTSYAKLKWDIIEKWNSDAKYTNDKLISMASELGVDIDSEDRKAIIAKVSDGVINAGVESGEYSVDSWGTDSDSDVWFKNYMGSLEIPVSNLSIDEDVDSNLHEHEDGTKHSHEDGDKPHHHHEDGTTHDHEGGDEPHTHDEELPDFSKMTKKALDEWAESQGIILDRRKTKAHMLEELNSKLN